MWEIDLRVAPGLPPGWSSIGAAVLQDEVVSVALEGALSIMIQLRVSDFASQQWAGSSRPPTAASQCEGGLSAL